MENSIQPQTVIIVNSNKKSMIAARLLTLFFGPLGLFYPSVLGGVIMLVINFIVAIFTLGFGLLITFPICIIWAIVAVNSHNTQTHTTQFGQHKS